MKDVFETLKKQVNRVGFGAGIHDLLFTAYQASAATLKKHNRVNLDSKVDRKSYTSFETKGKRLSRPINTELFHDDDRAVARLLRQLLKGDRGGICADDITRTLYTVAISFCAARDLTSDRDRKTQGTFFEYLCGAVMEATLGISPVRKLPVLNLDLKGDLPTDLVFDLGNEKPKFHLPVKTSTRERIIQVWAHQRVLDGVYGVGRFLAIPLVLTETKLDTRRREVVEICLPWQWRLYQMHIASLWNVCYFDIPEPYRMLDTVFPRVGVSTVGEFLAEKGRLHKLLQAHSVTAP
jgi:hypothetical protein